MTTKAYDKRLTVDIALDYPVTVGGVKYDVLTMRRPKTKDSLIAAGYKGSDAEKGVRLYANLCTFKGEPVSPDVIEELDDVDSDKLGEQHKAFTGRQAD